MNYQLGKLPARQDARTLKLADVLQIALPPVPDSFDNDAGRNIPNPMFGNDVWGDCVIAGRAHMTRRFESVEQGACIPISDSEVLHEYWREQGAAPSSRKRFCKTVEDWPSQPNNGLVMLDSLKAWRAGWPACGENYSIYAFAGVDWHNRDQVRAAIFLLGGLYVGIALPISAQNQEVWDADDSPNGAPSSWGGHCVYIPAYSPDGLECVTWGARKKMTWAFWDKYIEECYAVVDNRDSWLSNSPVDIEKLDAYLAALEK